MKLVYYLYTPTPYFFVLIYFINVTYESSMYNLYLFLCELEGHDVVEAPPRWGMTQIEHDFI